MFPKAKEGYKQVYIQLPVAKNENDLKVEVFVGLKKC
jgi:ecotin